MRFPQLCPVALVAVLIAPARPAQAADVPVVLQESFVPGYQYHVSTRVELEGNLSMPADKEHTAPRPLSVTGTSAIEYDERVLRTETDGRVGKTARIYRRIEFNRKVGDRLQFNTIRPEVRRLVVLRLAHVEVPFSPDGPLAWGEIDLVRTDVFTPALTGLLPSQAVQAGDRWAASTTAIQELTDLERIDAASVECRFEQITTLDSRRHARVAFSGSARGINEDGPNRQDLDGYFFFDLEKNHLDYLSLKGINSLLDKDSKVVGHIEGRFVLTRRAERASDLSDEAARTFGIEPSAENTLLVYENPDLGLRFLYPRRWRVAGVSGSRVSVDESNGSGLMLTLEPPGRMPRSTAFQEEVRNWLLQQHAKILRIESPRALAGASPVVEHFSCEVELGGQRIILSYYLSSQAFGGAILSARLLPADLQAVEAEAERIARSVTITRALPDNPKK
jgi:hypothetical protein